MPAGVYNFKIEQGATFKRKLTWNDAQSNPQNLTGFTARMHLREKFTDATPVLALTTENGRITLGGANGEIDLLISDEDTATIAQKKLKYDLELENASGEVTRLLEGTVTVKQEVTK